MTLSRLIAGVSDFLGTRLAPPPVAVSGSKPVDDDDVPAVTVWAEDTTSRMVGVGGLPVATRTGHHRVDRSFDLTSPAVTFPDGESVDLLSPDRRRLHFPHGPVVDAGGTAVEFLTAADLDVAVDGNPLTVVTAEPASGQVRGDTRNAELVFGDPLPATGDLDIGFFVGEWEVRLTRYQGRLHLVATDEDAPAADALSRHVEQVMAGAAPTGVAGLLSATPVSFGPVITAADKEELASRELVYAVDYEFEDVLLGSGGGVIGRVAAAIDAQFGETFDVTREGSSP